MNTDRIFIVGAPRSGTTFLWSAIAAHPQVLALPETGFFEAVFPFSLRRTLRDESLIMDCRRKSLGWHETRRHMLILRKLSAISSAFGEMGFHARRLRAASYVADFVSLVDRTACRFNKNVWVEKTPNHIFCVDLIEQHVPDARFIHILRNGQDVISSTVYASIAYERAWTSWAFCQGLPWLVAYWNASVQIHEAHAKKANHFYVYYEKLIDNFSAELRKIINFIGCDGYLPDCQSNLAHAISITDEPWKADALSGRVIPPKDRMEEIFGAYSLKWLKDHLTPYEKVRTAINTIRSSILEPSRSTAPQAGMNDE